MNYPALKGLWVPAMSKELHRLAQGKEGVGTNTILYLVHDEIKRIPNNSNVMYARTTINHRPQKNNLNQVRITVGGNLINYLYELTTRTADMVSAKIMWNSVISTPRAKFGVADIKKCITKPHSIDMSTCKCPTSSFQMTSSTTTIYVRKPSMAMYTWKFDTACMVYHKPSSWQISYYANAYGDMATSKYNTCPVFGNTSPSQSGLICASTTLVSNTLVTKISSTFFLHCTLLRYALKHEKLLRIRLVISTVALISSGTTANIG
jgi:hypothetical protein